MALFFTKMFGSAAGTKHPTTSGLTAPRLSRQLGIKELTVFGPEFKATQTGAELIMSFRPQKGAWLHASAEFIDEANAPQGAPKQPMLVLWPDQTPTKTALTELVTLLHNHKITLALGRAEEVIEHPDFDVRTVSLVDPTKSAHAYVPKPAPSAPLHWGVGDSTGTHHGSSFEPAVISPAQTTAAPKTPGLADFLLNVPSSSENRIRSTLEYLARSDSSHHRRLLEFLDSDAHWGWKLISLTHTDSYTNSLARAHQLDELSRAITPTIRETLAAELARSVAATDAAAVLKGHWAADDFHRLATKVLGVYLDPSHEPGIGREGLLPTLTDNAVSQFPEPRAWSFGGIELSPKGHYTGIDLRSGSGQRIKLYLVRPEDLDRLPAELVLTGIAGESTTVRDILNGPKKLTETRSGWLPWGPKASEVTPLW